MYRLFRNSCILILPSDPFINTEMKTSLKKFDKLVIFVENTIKDECDVGIQYVKSAVTERGDMFLRNVGLSPNYTTLQPRRSYCRCRENVKSKNTVCVHHNSIFSKFMQEFKFYQGYSCTSALQRVSMMESVDANDQKLYVTFMWSPAFIIMLSQRNGFHCEFRGYVICMMLVRARWPATLVHCYRMEVCSHFLC
jgi:hypothetical protein